MAKKTKKVSKKELSKEMTENMLPQNILSVGERVEENKNIYISQSVYKEIQKFTKNKTTDESGGMLVGKVIEDFGKTNIIISGFVEAKYCEATPTTLKFTHETWEYVHKEIDKKHVGKKIVGWIHTHPDFGIFLSEYDKFIHQNFFSEAHQIAYVVDPIQKIEGFYFWINGNIEKCKGFYIYDKTGVKITVGADNEEQDEVFEKESPLSFRNILIAVLSVAVVFLFISNLSSNNKLAKLEKKVNEINSQQQMLAYSASQSLYNMQALIDEQAEEIDELRAALIKEGIIEEKETLPETDLNAPENPENENTNAEVPEETMTDTPEETASETIAETGAETSAETTAETAE